MRVGKFGRAAAIGMSLLLVSAGAVLADTIIIENTVNLNDNVTKAAPSTGTATLRLLVTNGTPDGDANGCNTQSGTNSQGSPLVVSLASNNAGVTLDSPGSVTFTECQDPAGVGTTDGVETIGYTVAANACGSATISVSGLSGGKNTLGTTRLYETSDVLVITLPACGPSFHFDGFHSPLNGLAPIDAKAGQGIAWKWNLYQSLGGPELNDASKYSVSSVKTSSGCVLNGTNDDAPAADDAGASGIRYDSQGSFVWKTLKSWAGTCRTFSLKYEGATVAEVLVSFPK